MKARIAKQIGGGMEAKLILGTFHSVCLRYLYSYGQLIGLRKGFTIVDASDSKAIILRIMKRHKLTIDANVARSRISKCKARNESYWDIQQKNKKKSVDQQEFQIVYEAYQGHLEASNLLDYDDLLTFCVQLLTAYPECVSNVDAVLIDEFQDTNNVQFMLMRLFAQRNKRITTVGDPDQSIYGWRSAEIKNLERMRNLYPDIHVIHLEDNYRSSGAILQAAQEVIEQDSSRPQKSLQATHCGGTPPVLRMLFSVEAEAQWVVAEMKRCMALTGEKVLDFSDFAILIRSASQSRQLELAMGHAAMPYRMVGGVRFFDRVEIKILLDYLRTIAHPSNSDAIARIVNIPPRGVGKDTTKELLEEATHVGRPLWDLIKDIVRGEGRCRTKISKQAERGLASFFNIIETVKKNLNGEKTATSPYELLELLIKRLEFKRYLEKTYPDDTENVRWANVEELLVQASDIDPRPEALEEDMDALPTLDDVEQREVGVPAEEALSRFLSNVALATEIQTEKEQDSEGRPRPSITLSTMHAAKGLEWPVVFIPSVYHGSIPHSRAEDHDEERRLLYVAMTRAQALLYLSCPTRSSRGDETTLSPFLDTKEVRSCLLNQGPSIHAHRVFDICSILRRDPPSYDDLIEAEKRTQYLDDDEFKWPLDGSANQEVLRPHVNEAVGMTLVSDNKRRKLSTVPYASKTIEIGQSSFSQRSGDIMRQVDTNKNLSTPVGGFMSAASQLKIQQEREDIRAVESLSSGSSLERLVPPKPQRAPKKAKGQSTITSLWSAPSQASVPPQIYYDSSIRKASPTLPTEVGLEHFSVLTKRGIHDVQPCRPSASLDNFDENTIARTRNGNGRGVLGDFGLPASEATVARPRMGSIPGELRNRSVRPGPSLKRSRTDPEGGVSRKRHVWSASSPSCTALADFNETGDLSEEQAAVSSESLVPGNKVHGRFLSTATFHKTTMAQLKETQNMPRKVLGMRANNSSWTSTGPQQFKVPQFSKAGKATRTQ